MRHHIRGTQFHIDTGSSEPICCRLKEYGAHESRIITKLCDSLQENGLIEDDDGPWGSRVVLAQKPDQSHKHWSEYEWRLCISYRPLNAITRPFTFPIPRCDYATFELGNMKVFISMDMKSGYWQIQLTDSSKAKTAFFVPDGKKKFTVMPMGATNALPFFVAFALRMRKEWDQLAMDRGIRAQDAQSKIIVDDILLAAVNEEILLKYFRCCLEILQHYRVTIHLRKCRFLHTSAEFVGFDITSNGNAPAASKFPAFKRLVRPHTYTDLRMLIGIFGFYHQFIEWLKNES